MKQNSFYVFTACKHGKYVSYARKIHNSNNLITILQCEPNLVSVNACDSLKEATAIAEKWNADARAAGTYLYA